MRIILILILIAAIFAVVQSRRHNCTFGEAGWFDCVIGKTATETPAGTMSPPAEAPAPAAPETPSPSTNP